MARSPLLRDFPDLPPVWALGAAFVSWALARALPLPSWPGWPLGAAGLGLIVWAAWWFRTRRTPIEPNEAPRALIVEGPFRINRNPIYTGLTLILAGWAFSLGALAALMPVLAFPAVITARFIRAEEAALRSAFGAEAEAWIAATRRW